MGSKTERARQELEDKAEKLLSAQEAVSRPGASQRDKSDLKMIEQDFQAQQQKADRLTVQSKEERDQPAGSSGKLEKKLDQALVDSFPASDPISFIEPTPMKKGDPSHTPADVGDNPRSSAHTPPRTRHKNRAPGR